MTDNTQPWRELVEQALRDHRYNEVVVRLKTILTEHPDSAQAWVFLGEALEHQKHRASAWRCFERAGILDPLAVWLPSVSQRLQTAHGAIPAWLNRLLTPPTVHVIGAILAKNESDNITRCIAALKPAVDEVLVVDTGSTDDTVALAEAAGARVIHTLWDNNFGQARQAADAALGTEGWVLWVDADEFLDAEDVDIPRLAAGIWSQIQPPTLLRIGQWNHMGSQAELNFDMTRMYPLGYRIHWEGRVHEQLIIPKPQVFQRSLVRIRVHHWGYEPDTMRRLNKYARNIALLREWIADDPDNPALWGFLGRDLLTDGQTDAAIQALFQAEALASAHPWYARMPEVHHNLCKALVDRQRLTEAYAVATRATLANPTHPHGWYWLGHIALLQADQYAQEALRAAAQMHRTLPQYTGPLTMPSVIAQVYAPLTEGDALRMMGRWAEAYQMYQSVALQHPEIPAAAQQVHNLTERIHAVSQYL